MELEGQEREVTWGLGSHGNEFACYLDFFGEGMEGETTGGFKQGEHMVWFTFLEDCSGFRMAREPKASLARNLAPCWEAQQQSKDLGGLDQAVKVERRGWIRDMFRE